MMKHLNCVISKVWQFLNKYEFMYNKNIHEIRIRNKADSK